MTCGGQLFDVIDLPGTYSLAPRSPDEMVAVDVVLGSQKEEARPDVVVSIVDASNLDRNLYLTTQALELGVPVVVALNMVDVAESQGIRIDADRLSRQLGVPVVPIQANKGKGLDDLRAAIAAAALEHIPAKGPSFPEAFEREVGALREAVGADTPNFLVRRLLLDVGGYTEKRLVNRLGPDGAETLKAARGRLAAAGCPTPGVEARTRYSWIREATAGCVQRPAKRIVTWTDRIDRVLTHKVWGTLVFLAIMFVVFQSIFTWRQPLMDGIDAQQRSIDRLAAQRDAARPADQSAARRRSRRRRHVLVFLPQILILFGFIAVLEDCGYMARAAFLMDKLMSRCGLSGKSFIPMLSSVACAVPGIMATRVIENRRDRLTTILVAPLMSCSARLPVYMLLIGAFLSPPRFPVVDARAGDVPDVLHRACRRPAGGAVVEADAAARRNAGVRDGDAAVQSARPCGRCCGACTTAAGPFVVPGRDADPGVDGPRLGAAVFPAHAKDRTAGSTMNITPN